MPAAQISIWKFSDAPPELTRFSRGLERPQWVALIPRSLYHQGFDEVILKQAGEPVVIRSETPEGDVVFIGAFAPVEVLALAGAGSHGTPDKL